jgi:hypothetical protein
MCPVRALSRVPGRLATLTRQYLCLIDVQQVRSIDNLQSTFPSIGIPTTPGFLETHIHHFISFLFIQFTFDGDTGVTHIEREVFTTANSTRNVSLSGFRVLFDFRRRIQDLHPKSGEWDAPLRPWTTSLIINGAATVTRMCHLRPTFVEGQRS